MQGIWNYARETNYVSRVYNVTGILWLQFITRVILFPMINLSFFYVKAVLLLLLLLHNF